MQYNNVKSVNFLACVENYTYLCTRNQTTNIYQPTKTKRDMEEYHATKEEVINLINKFDETTTDGKIALNEVAKQAYCESICNGVIFLEEAEQYDLLDAIYAKFNGNIEQLDDIFSVLTSPRILSGELDLEQCREVYGYVQTELDNYNKMLFDGLID